MSLISYRVRLARNYSDLPFPNCANPDDLAEVVHRIQETFDMQPVAIASLAAHERERLLEKRKISKDLLAGQGHMLDLGDVVIMINEEDHLRIQAFSETDLEAAFYKAHDVANQLEHANKFAWHEKWGYLTTCVTNVGSGCRFSALLHLPVTTLGKDVANTLFGHLGNQIMVRGTFGEKSNVLGHLYQVSTQNMMSDPTGVMNIFKSRVHDLLRANEEILTNFRSKKIASEILLTLRDRIMRAYGILRYAQLLDYQEAVENLSLVVLGLQIHAIPMPLFSEKEVIALFSEIGRGQLSSGNNKVNIAEKRASLIRGRLFGQ